MIEALVIDLGGVAARFRPERRLQALETMSGVAQEIIRERLFDSGFERQAELGDYTAVEVIATVLAKLDHRVSAAVLVDAWALAFEPDSEILAYIASLPGRSVLFTNNGPMLDACLDGPLQDLAAVFDDVICSWHIGARKPDTVAFKRATERLGSAPEHLLLLDDSLENVEAAIRNGWDADQVSDYRSLVTALGKRQLQPRSTATPPYPLDSGTED